MSAHLSIQNAIAAALAPALPAGVVGINHLRPIPDGQSAAIVVRLDQSSAQEHMLGMFDWSTRYTVECYTRAVAGADPAAAPDALLVSAWAALSALDLSPHGAMTATLQPQIDWQYDTDAAGAATCAVISLTVQHRTPAASLVA